MVLCTLAVGLVLIALAQWIWSWLTQPDYSRLPKSPTRLPLLGNIHLFAKGQPFHLLANDIAKDYGNVFTLWSGSEPTVFIGDHQLATELFVGNSQVASDRLSNCTAIAIATIGYKGIAFRARDKQLQLNRKVGASALRDLFSNKNDSCAIMLDAECKRLIGKLVKAGADGVGFDPACFVYELTTRIMGGTCFGKAFTDDRRNDDKARDLANVAFKALRYSTLLVVKTIPLLRFVPFFELNSVYLFAESRDELTEAELRRHRQSLKEGDPPRDVTDVLLSTRQGHLDDSERKMVLTDLIVAGSETVSTTLNWSIFCLVRNRQWQTKLREAINASVTTADDLPSVDMRSLPLLRAFYHEVLRWSSALPTSIIHVVSDDVTIGQYHIPKGTSVMTLTHLIHNDPKHWVQPDVFNPARFIDENGAFSIPTKSYMPFSIGPRACLGDSLAKRELFFALLYIVYHFHVLPEVEGHLPPVDVYEETTVRPRPYKVRMRPTRPSEQSQ